MAGPQVNNVVPAIQHPPAPNIMDPGLQCGLYNPNAYVRGGVVEAMGKTYGATAMRKAEREESDAKARVKYYASQPIKPYAPVVLTDEELAAFEELVRGEDEDENEEMEMEEEEEDEEEKEEAIAAEENGGAKHPTGLNKEANEAAVEATAAEKMAQEKAKHGIYPDDGTVESESREKMPVAGPAAVEEIGVAKPAEKQQQQKKKKVRHPSFHPYPKQPLTLHTASEASTCRYSVVLAAGEGAGWQVHVVDAVPVGSGGSVSLFLGDVAVLCVIADVSVVVFALLVLFVTG